MCKKLIARRNAHAGHEAPKTDFEFGHYFRLTVEGGVNPPLKRLQ
jgi:hypothetical protein